MTSTFFLNKKIIYLISYSDVIYLILFFNIVKLN